jgi:hypothetical protein
MAGVVLGEPLSLLSSWCHFDNVFRINVQVIALHSTAKGFLEVFVLNRVLQSRRATNDVESKAL